LIWRKAWQSLCENQEAYSQQEIGRKKTSSSEAKARAGVGGEVGGVVKAAALRKSSSG
jgi:hypothetical protein